MTKAMVMAVLLAAASPALGQVCSTDPAPAVKDTAPLCAVVAGVTAALDRYQAGLAGGKDALPPLQHAEFDFKTTSEVTAGAKIALFVFTLGASHEKDVTNEVAFLYEVPKPHAGASRAHATGPSLEDELYATIVGAAEQVRMAEQVGKVPFQSLEVTIAFCAKRDGNAGVNAPISLVTVGLNADKSRNVAQTVKLVFARP